MDQQIAALAIVMVVLVGGVGAISAQFEQSVEGSNTLQTVGNEQVTITKPGINRVAESNRDVVYADNVTIRDAGGTELDAAGNYTWYDSNGTFYVPSGSDLTDGNTASIDYNYTEPSEAQVATRDVGLILPRDLGETIPIIIGLAILLGSVGMLARNR